jgi:hypothetical protein
VVEIYRVENIKNRNRFPNILMENLLKSVDPAFTDPPLSFADRILALYQLPGDRVTGYVIRGDDGRPHCGVLFPHILPDNLPLKSAAYGVMIDAQKELGVGLRSNQVTYVNALGSGGKVISLQEIWINPSLLSEDLSSLTLADRTQTIWASWFRTGPGEAMISLETRTPDGINTIKDMAWQWAENYGHPFDGQTDRAIGKGLSQFGVQAKEIYNKVLLPTV